MNNLVLFCDTYRKHLTKARTEHPEEYPWPIEQLPTVADKMVAAIQRGSFNKESRSFRATCKELGIKHTYTAINAFINQE